MTIPATLTALLALGALACVPGHHLAIGCPLAVGALLSALWALHRHEARTQ